MKAVVARTGDFYFAQTNMAGVVLRNSSLSSATDVACAEEKNGATVYPPPIITGGEQP